MTLRLLRRALSALLAAAVLAGPAAALPRARCGGAEIHPCCRPPEGQSAPVAKRAPCCELKGSPVAPPKAPATPPAPSLPDAPAAAVISTPPLAAVFAAVALPTAGVAAPGHGPPIHIRDRTLLL